METTQEVKLPRTDGTPTNAEIRRWLRQVETGKRSMAEVERTELGTRGRGKTVTRLAAKRGVAV